MEVLTTWLLKSETTSVNFQVHIYMIAHQPHASVIDNVLTTLQLWLVMFVAYICVVAAYFCTSFTVCVLVSKSSEGL